MREERERKALGRGAVRYQNGHGKAECQVRYGGDGMRCAGADWMARATTRGRMMRRIRNREGLKQADEIRREPGARNPRTNWFT